MWRRSSLTRSRRPATALFALALILFAAGCGERSFRAFWADAFHPGFKSVAEIDEMVAWATAGNYNAMFVEVLAYHDTGSSGHGAYWSSSIVPMASDITGGIDPLAELVARGHSAGVEVHAWVVPYRVSNTWPPNGNTLLTARPEWLMVPRAYMGGGPATVGGHYTLDPGSPEAQDYLVGIVREIISGYGVDGVNLDYIRYVQTDAGYPAYTSEGSSSLARFKDLTGYAGTPAPTGVPSWNDFRRRTVDELVRRLHAEIPSATSNPRQPLRFTADLISFGDAPASFEDTSAYELHQNWRLWMEKGWLDAAVPMNYKREHDADQARWYRNWVDAALDWRYDRHLFAGQGAYMNTKIANVSQLAYAFDAGADGAVTYSYFATADENMNGIPENDWTWYGYLAYNLFTLPVLTPAMPWRMQANAVEGTLWGRITDGATGEAVDGAVVAVGGIDPVETDGNGYFVASRVAAGGGGTAYDVTVDAWDCPEVTVAGVVVRPGAVMRRDVSVCGER